MLPRKTIIFVMLCFVFNTALADAAEDQSGEVTGFSCPEKMELKQSFFKSGIIEDYCLDKESGEKQGHYVHYKDSDRKIKLEEGTYNQGRIEGSLTLWYENGNVKARGEMLNSARQGLWKFYNEEGVLISSENYVAGELEGIRTRFYKNGQKKDEVSYAEGKKSGTYTLWYENGKIKTSGEISDNKKQGKWESWGEEGVTEGYSTYKDGILNGESTTFWPDGKEKTRANYVNGNYDGEFVEFYENGEKKTEGSYSEGSKVGKWQYWDENGKLENSREMVKEIARLLKKRKYIEANNAIMQCLNKFPGDRYCSRYTKRVTKYTNKMTVHHIKDAGIYEEGDGYQTWMTLVNKRGRPVKSMGTLTLYLELERDKKLIESYKLETVEVVADEFEVQKVGEYGKERKMLVYKHFIRFDKQYEHFRKLEYNEELYLRFEFKDYLGGTFGERDEFHME